MTVVNLPDLPAEAGAELQLKMEIAIATIAIKKRCGLQEAADWVQGTMTAVDQAVTKVAAERGPVIPAPPRPQVRVRRVPQPELRGPTVAGPSQGQIER